MPPPRYDVFLSHNSADKPLVDALARKLEAAGLKPWLDSRVLVSGEPWAPRLEQGLEQSASCAVCFGAAGFGNWHAEEMWVAFNHQVSKPDRNFRVIPVLLPGAERPERSLLPAVLRSRTWVEFRESIDDDSALHRLVCGIQGIEPGPGPGEAAYEGQCPYRALKAFDEEHTHFFFGREALTDWLVNALRPVPGRPENRFLAIVGPSGSGKSSVALAGLVPALRQGKLEGSHQWPIAILRPGHNPLESLARALVQAGWSGGTSPLSSLPALREALGRNPRTLHEAVAVVLPVAEPDRRMVVLIDQFEEVFTVCGDDTLRQAFIDNLLQAATVPGGQALVVLSMRADFYGQCAHHDGLAAAVSDRQVLVVRSMPTSCARPSSGRPRWWAASSSRAWWKRCSTTCAASAAPCRCCSMCSGTCGSTAVGTASPATTTSRAAAFSRRFSSTPRRCSRASPNPTASSAGAFFCA